MIRNLKTKLLRLRMCTVQAVTLESSPRVSILCFMDLWVCLPITHQKKMLETLPVFQLIPWHILLQKIFFFLFKYFLGNIN